jgi:hypothetical protein
MSPTTTRPPAVTHPMYGTGLLIRTFRDRGHDYVLAQFPGFPMATHHRSTSVTVKAVAK